MSRYAEHRARAYLNAAESLHQEARALEAKAAEARRKAAVEGVRNHLDRIAEMIVRDVERGRSEQKALARLEQDEHLAPGQAAALYAKALKRRRWVRIWRRDREIIRLAWEGRSNAEIAAQIAHLNGGKPLHPVTVSKIVSRKLKTRGPQSPGQASFSPLAPLKDQI